MSSAAPPPGRNAPASRRSNAPAPAAGNRNPAWATSCGARAGTRRCGTAEEAAAVWFIAPSDPRLASAQAAGGGAEDQQAQPVSVRIGKGLPELLAPRRGRRSGNDAGRAFGGRGLWLARWTAVRLTDRRKWGCFSHSCLPRGWCLVRLFWPNSKMCSVPRVLRAVASVAGGMFQVAAALADSPQASYRAPARLRGTISVPSSASHKLPTGLGLVRTHGFDP
jgi:hypothetical protein